MSGSHVTDRCCDPQLMVKKQQKQQPKRTDPIVSIEDWFSLLQELPEDVLGQSIRQQEVIDSPKEGWLSLARGP